jgi:hypothetical protein
MNAAGVLKCIHHVPVGQVEIEFRAGTFRKKNFTPGVGVDIFDSIHRRLSMEMNPTNEQTVDTIYGEYRVCQGGDVLQKIKLFSQDFFEHNDDHRAQGVRLSVASELDVPRIASFVSPPTKHKFERHKDRTTFRQPGGAWKVDLTKVLSLEDKDQDMYSFEIEVELEDRSRLLTVPLHALLAEGMGLLNAVLDVTEIEKKKEEETLQNEGGRLG